MPKPASSKPDLIPLEHLEEAAECLRTLAHPHRLRMVQMLLRAEHSVGELAEACGIPPHHASQHLGLMRDRGLLSSERRGREVFHRVVEQQLAGIIDCMESRYCARPPG